MRGVLFTLILTHLFFSSCNNTPPKDVKQIAKKQTFMGSWRIENATGSSGGNPLRRELKERKSIQVGQLLSFYPDGSFTRIDTNRNYKYGKWKFVNSKKSIVLEDGSLVDTLNLKSRVVDNQMKIQLTDVSTKARYECSRFIEIASDFKLDPFYNTNNVWRIKAIVSENENQLSDRLTNYIKHLACILKTASENNQKIVSFEFSQGIVKLYSGGIGIHPITVISQNWLHTYFSEKEALAAHNMFKQYLRLNKYRGSGTGNWYVDDYNILMGICSDAKEGKFIVLK
jgi:hypothetical protein